MVQRFGKEVGMKVCKTGRYEYCAVQWCHSNRDCWANSEKTKGRRGEKTVKRMKIIMYNDGENGGELFGFNIAGDDITRIIQEGIEVLELMKKRGEPTA